MITHLSLRTPDMALAVQDALAHGAASVEGKGAHWVRLPNGVALELKPWKKES